MGYERHDLPASIDRLVFLSTLLSRTEDVTGLVNVLTRTGDMAFDLAVDLMMTSSLCLNLVRSVSPLFNNSNYFLHILLISNCIGSTGQEQSLLHGLGLSSIRSFIAYTMYL